MDHGAVYLSSHFQNRIKYRGVNPGFAFTEPPQTNGVAERLIKTLKEQVIYGRVFRNLEEVREAVRRFMDTDNREWLMEITALRSPGRSGRNGLSRPHSPRRLKKTCVRKTGGRTLVRPANRPGPLILELPVSRQD
jgi:transposase InsO family protein